MIVLICRCQVEMQVTDDGVAVSVARVRCERTVPIRGSSGNMFQRSSVIVTKRIQVRRCKNVVTSAKEVMFLPVFVCPFVCLFVCLSVCLCVSKINQKVMDGSF